MKKLTFASVHSAFSDRGWELLSEEYINSVQKLQFRCEKGHNSAISWSKFNGGRNCPQCSSSARLTLDYVSKSFEERGWKLLENNYVNCAAKLKFECENGHKHHITWSSFNQGHGCAECSSTKISIAEAAKKITSRGWQLLSSEITTCKEKLDCVCDNGHRIQIRYNDFQQGVGCSFCNSKRKLSIDYVRQSFASYGWELLSSNYVRATAKLDFRCQNGHVRQISWQSFQSGIKCAECSVKYTVQEVKALFQQKGFTLLSDKYENAHAKLKFVCQEGHIAKTNLHSLLKGSGCASCAVTGFKPYQPGILYYIKFIYNEVAYYKIGITNNSVKKRFKSEKNPYTIIHQELFDIGQHAYDKEQQILRDFDAYRIKTRFLVSGNSEVFSTDILKLDIIRVSTVT